MDKIKKVCSYCYSDEIDIPADAQWDVEKQRWEITNAFDKRGHCNKCDGPCIVEDSPI